MTVPVPPGDLRRRLSAAFAWRPGRAAGHSYAEVSGWWQDPDLLANLGPALADLFRSDGPTVVLSPQSSGFIIGPLVATSLGVGFVAVLKDHRPTTTDQWLQRTTPPDYRDRHLSLGFRRGQVQQSDRVLLVDDWVDTGGQLLGVQSLVADTGATWLGAAVIVDALNDHRVRRLLQVRALLHERDL
jgi:adenine phosphoribosyltransferase